MKTFLRACWAFAGLILSAPAFLPPLAGAIAFLAIGGLSGNSLPRMLAVLWEQPHGSAWFAIAALYGVYWACVGFLVVQFVFDKELSLVPLAIVAVVIASVLVALKPWHDPGVPFTLGPFALLHVAYLATLAWPSLRRSTASTG